jgi:hypothetical protein
MARKVKIEFYETPAVLLLAKSAQRWRGDGPQSSQDTQWLERNQERWARIEAVIAQLATEHRIRFPRRTLEFWKALAYRLIDLFPVAAVIPETRGRASRGRKIPSALFREIDLSPGKVSAKVLEVAAREGVVRATLERRFREWKKTGKKT